jgi:hypothetical protein
MNGGSLGDPGASADTSGANGDRTERNRVWCKTERVRVGNTGVTQTTDRYAYDA